MRLLSIEVTTGALSLNGDGDDLLLEVEDHDLAATAMVAFKDPEDALRVARNIQAWAERAISLRADRST
jgi:hypothetical protein